MIKVLQYGEGNFLRTFVDVYFDTVVYLLYNIKHKA